MSAPILPHVIAPGFSYQHHPGHRDGTAGKSQWSVTETEERGIFDHSRMSQWLSQYLGWGVHVVTGQAVYLGNSDDSARSLIIAKFVASNSPKIWHGYPADHQRRIQDIPEPKILMEWMRLKYLKPAKIRKLMRGQPCSL